MRSSQLRIVAWQVNALVMAGLLTVSVGEAQSPSLVASVLPGSRSVPVGTPATAFASVLNSGTSAATGCGLSLATRLPATFAFQVTDPTSNRVTGVPNALVDIPAGGLQTFVFAVTPTGPFGPTEVQILFDCADSEPAPIIAGLNTLLLSASESPGPDIVALAATAGNDGIVNLATPAGTGAFAMATVNVGADASITVSGDTGAIGLPVDLLLCQTNPVDGRCLSAAAASVTTQMNSGSVATFGVFVTGGGMIPFDPAHHRVFLRLRDGAGVVRGTTSVAVRTVEQMPVAVLDPPDFLGRIAVENVGLRDVSPAPEFTPDTGGACQVVLTIRNLTDERYLDVSMDFEVVDTSGVPVTADLEGHVVPDVIGEVRFVPSLATPSLDPQETKPLVSDVFGLPCVLAPALMGREFSLTFIDSR